MGVLGLITPVNIRSATLTITDEQVTIPLLTPYQSRLLEVPSSTEGVKIRRITSAVKSGTGSGSMQSVGYYVGLTTKDYKIEIDTAGEIGIATFKWSNNGGTTWQGTLVPIPDTDPIDLELGVQVQFAGGTGQDFNLGDYWTFTAECWTEVTSVPVATKTFQVNYANGLVTFYSGDAGMVVYASYEGRGSVVKAEDIKQLIDTLDQGELLMRNLNTAGLTANKAVYVKSDGTFGLASGAAPSTLAIGFVKVVDSAEGEIIVHGRLSGFSGLTTGVVYYLDTEGNITTTPTQAYKQAVGKALSGTTLLVNCVLEAGEDIAGKVVLMGVNTSGVALSMFVGMTTAGGWAQAQAHWSVKRPATGCVKKVGSTDGEIILFGIQGGFTGLTRGQKYYLSETGGGINPNPPTDSGDIVQVIGIGYSSTELLVWVAADYSEVP